MIVTDKGINIDLRKINAALMGRTMDVEGLFAAITVNPPVESKRDTTVMIDTTYSSVFAYAAYNVDALRLVVRFRHGGMFRYEGITAQEAMDFAQAESMGRWFHENIKNKKVAVKV